MTVVAKSYMVDFVEFEWLGSNASSIDLGCDNSLLGSLNRVWLGMVVEENKFVVAYFVELGCGKNVGCGKVCRVLLNWVVAK